MQYGEFNSYEEYVNKMSYDVKAFYEMSLYFVTVSLDEFVKTHNEISEKYTSDDDCILIDVDYCKSQDVDVGDIPVLSITHDVLHVKTEFKNLKIHNIPDDCTHIILSTDSIEFGLPYIFLGNIENGVYHTWQNLKWVKHDHFDIPPNIFERSKIQHD